MSDPYDDKVIERIAARIIKMSAPGERRDPSTGLPRGTGIPRVDLIKCWHYKGTHSIDGQPVISYRGKQVYVHRLIMQLTQPENDLPYVIQECGDSKCINPRHLKFTDTKRTKNNPKGVKE